MGQNPSRGSVLSEAFEAYTCGDTASCHARSPLFLLVETSRAGLVWLRYVMLALLPHYLSVLRRHISFVALKRRDGDSRGQGSLFRRGPDQRSRSCLDIAVAMTWEGTSHDNDKHVWASTSVTLCLRSSSGGLSSACTAHTPSVTSLPSLSDWVSP